MNLCDEVNSVIEKKTININDIENSIRDHLSGTSRITNPKLLFSVLKDELGNALKKSMFDKVWKSLIKDKFLIATKGGYKWE